MDALGRLLGVRSVLAQMGVVYLGERKREKVERLGRGSGAEKKEEETKVREGRRKFEVLVGGIETVMNGLWELMEDADGWEELEERRGEALEEFEEMGDLIERWRETLERAEGRCEEEEWDIVEEE